MEFGPLQSLSQIDAPAGVDLRRSGGSSPESVLR